MSQKSQERRIRNLTRRIKQYEDAAEKCEGLSGYACIYGNYSYAPGCINHWPTERFEYERKVRSLNKILARK